LTVQRLAGTALPDQPVMTAPAVSGMFFPAKVQPLAWLPLIVSDRSSVSPGCMALTQTENVVQSPRINPQVTIFEGRGGNVGWVLLFRPDAGVRDSVRVELVGRRLQGGY